MNSALDSQPYRWCQNSQRATGSGGVPHQEDALPGDEHVVEPHLAVEFVEAAAERATNGLASRAAILRHTMVTPGALTGTMKVARWPPRSMPDRLPT